MPASGFRVEDLLRSPALQLRLIAGAGGTGRRVSWAHVSELEDPTPWLSGGEMIMTTGMAVPQRRRRPSAPTWSGWTPRGSRASRCRRACSCRRVTAALLAAADRRGFPMVEVPIPVPFITIAQEVARPRSRWTTRSGSTPSCRCSGRCAGWPRACPPWRSSPGWNGCRATRCTRARCSGGRCSTGSRCHRSGTPELMPSTATSPPTVPGGYVLPVSGPRGTAGYILAMERADAMPPGRRLGGAAHRHRGRAAAVHARP